MRKELPTAYGVRMGSLQKETLVMDYKDRKEGREEGILGRGNKA